MCLSIHIACIIIMHDRICLVLCRPRSSLATWLASAMASFLCLGQWVSMPHCFSFGIYTGRSNVSK